MINLQKNSELQ